MRTSRLPNKESITLVPPPTTLTAPPIILTQSLFFASLDLHFLLKIRPTIIDSCVDMFTPFFGHFLPIGLVKQLSFYPQHFVTLTLDPPPFLLTRVLTLHGPIGLPRHSAMVFSLFPKLSLWLKIYYGFLHVIAVAIFKNSSLAQTECQAEYALSFKTGGLMHI